VDGRRKDRLLQTNNFRLQGEKMLGIKNGAVDDVNEGAVPDATGERIRRS